MIACFKCNSEDVEVGASQDWRGFKASPVRCLNCNLITWLREEMPLLPHGTKQREQIPPHLEYTKVYVVNKVHPRHLSPGTIIARDHLHYRIRFNDGVIIWMPQHWVDPIPSEML